MDTEFFSTLGVVGALVWFMYYVMSTYIPNLTTQHTQSNERLAKQNIDSTERLASNFAITQKEISDNFANTLKEEREYRKEEIVALQKWISNEASCRYRDPHDHC